MGRELVFKFGPDLDYTDGKRTSGLPAHVHGN